MLTTTTHNCTVHIGNREGYNGEQIFESRLKNVIRTFQLGNSEARTVAISSQTYQFRDYIESGWRIDIINYPRFPTTVDKLEKFAIDLATHLRIELKQNRVTVVTPTHTYLLGEID